MSDIPYQFWMVIVAVLASALLLIMYYFANILKELGNTTTELTKAVQKSNTLLDDAHSAVEKANNMLDDVQEAVSATKATLLEVNQTVIAPVRSIGGFLGIIKSFVDGFKGE